MRLVVAETKATKIHLIAHSMGNVVLTEALAQLDRDTVDRLKFGELILAAPDIDPARFTQVFQAMQTRGARGTVYASGADRALGLSGWLRGAARLGYITVDGPTLVSGVDTIDITDVGFSLFGLNHDVYAASPVIVGDMKRLLLAGERPPDKRSKALQLTTTKQGTFWRYRPLGATPEPTPNVAQ